VSGAGKGGKIGREILNSLSSDESCAIKHLMYGGIHLFFDVQILLFEVYHLYGAHIQI
jgi:hypothetical protein